MTLAVLVPAFVVAEVKPAAGESRTVKVIAFDDVSGRSGFPASYLDEFAEKITDALQIAGPEVVATLMPSREKRDWLAFDLWKAVGQSQYVVRGELDSAGGQDVMITVRLHKIEPGRKSEPPIVARYPRDDAARFQMSDKRELKVDAWLERVSAKIKDHVLGNKTPEIVYFDCFTAKGGAPLDHGWKVPTELQRQFALIKSANYEVAKEDLKKICSPRTGKLRNYDKYDYVIYGDIEAGEDRFRCSVVHLWNALRNRTRQMNPRPYEVKAMPFDQFGAGFAKYIGERLEEVK